MRASLLMKITAILLVALTVFALASCSIADPAEEETTTEPEVVTMVARPKDGDKAQILAFYNDVVNQIKTVKPGVSRTVKCDVRDIETPDAPEAKAMMQFAKSFAGALEKNSESSEYGAKLDEFMPLCGTGNVSLLTEADVAEATIADVEDDRYAYDITIILVDSDASGAVSRAFDLQTEEQKKEVMSTFADYKESVEVSDYEVTYTACELHARVNKETNQVMSMSLVKNASVTASVYFPGALSEIGETDVSFVLRQETSFNDFVWEKPTEAPAEE